MMPSAPGLSPFHIHIHIPSLCVSLSLSFWLSHIPWLSSKLASCTGFLFVVPRWLWLFQISHLSTLSPAGKKDCLRPTALSTRGHTISHLTCSSAMWPCTSHQLEVESSSSPLGYELALVTNRMWRKWCQHDFRGWDQSSFAAFTFISWSILQILPSPYNPAAMLSEAQATCSPWVGCSCRQLQLSPAFKSS